MKQQNRGKGAMSAAGYAVREIERRQLNQPSAGDRSVDSGADRENQAAPLSARSRDKSAKANRVPEKASPDPRVAQKSDSRKRPVRGEFSGNSSGSNAGYLKQHVDDEEEDRRIRELEREVANLEALGSVGRTGSKPRAASAISSRRRPSGDGPRSVSGAGTPSSVSSRRSASAGRPTRPTKKLNNAQQVSIVSSSRCLFLM